MRLCFLLGRASEALGQYERLRSIWAEELDAEPSATSEALREKIIRQLNAGVRPTHADNQPPLLDAPAQSAFVGREHERRDLVDSIEDVLAGSDGVVLVEGEPGAGKTRLAIETAEDAQWRGFEVTWGKCTERALRPFAPLAEVCLVES
jgi:transcriptional regulator with AAA-type ATPase domain